MQTRRNAEACLQIWKVQGSGATSYTSNEEDIYSIAYRVLLNVLTLLCCVQNVSIISHSIMVL